MSTDRAHTLCKRFTLATIALFVAGTIASLLGFDWFSTPLFAVGAITMWRGSYWDGWCDAHDPK